MDFIGKNFIAQSKNIGTSLSRGCMSIEDSMKRRPCLENIDGDHPYPDTFEVVDETSELRF